MDLKKYAKRIYDDKDKPLFNEGISAAEAGAYRACYIMFWLSCAESLKRRFEEAAKWDHTAGEIVGKIKEKESNQKSIDKFLLDKSLDYGFLSESAKIILMHIYEMRCVYGHPYEEAPTEEQIVEAASSAVEHLLSEPVKLGQGFGDRLIAKLLNEEHYLDDYRKAVQEYAQNILLRIDEGIFGWFLEKYWGELEDIAADASLKIFFKRGVWFSQTVLREYGISMFDQDEWHSKTTEYPSITMRVFVYSELFKSMGQNAQDAIISAYIKKSEKCPKFLQFIDYFNKEGLLTERQSDRFKSHVQNYCRGLENHITHEGAKWLRSTGLSIEFLYETIIDALESHNWYIQNPISELVANNLPKGLEALDSDQQENLGRNILQAAEGTAGSAIKLIENLAKEDKPMPTDFVFGLVAECFFNDDGKVRFKIRNLQNALQVLHCQEEYEGVLLKVTEQIENGDLKKPRFMDERDIVEVIDEVGEDEWLSSLKESLCEKRKELFGS